MSAKWDLLLLADVTPYPQPCTEHPICHRAVPRVRVGDLLSRGGSLTFQESCGLDPHGGQDITLLDLQVLTVRNNAGVLVAWGVEATAGLWQQAHVGPCTAPG